MKSATKALVLSGTKRVHAGRYGTVLGDFSGPSYDPDASALFARMSVQPDDTRKDLINDLILALKAAGVWTKFDAFYVTAAHDSQAGRLNWVSSDYTLSAFNSPTFTIDRGYAGNGTTSYLDTGFSPNTSPSPKYIQNRCHMGVWIGTDVAAASQWDCGHSRSLIVSRVLTPASQAALRVNQTTGVNYTLPVDTSIGWLAFSRSAGTSFNAKKNNAAPTNLTQTSASLAIGGNFFLGAIANTSNTATNFSSRRIQAYHFGVDLTDTELANLYTALAAYMTAIGA